MNRILVNIDPVPKSPHLSLKLVCGHHWHHRSGEALPRVIDCKECDMLAAGNETLHERVVGRTIHWTRTSWDPSTHLPLRVTGTREMLENE